MAATALEKARAHYAELIATLAAVGRRDDAMACAQLAVSQGIWADPWQRPIHYVPELPAAPRYDRRRFPVAAYLERHYPAIRAELDGVTNLAEYGFSPVEEPLVGRGRWDQVMFYEAGHRFARAAALFPATAAVLDGLPEAARRCGVAMFSWLHPGSHIVPHCGHTNARLRIHLGLRTPPGARIRVKDQDLTWTEGECLVFDDSFEHEVWHLGSEPRVVLLLDIFHPALPDAERTKMVASKQQSQDERARQFMQERGLRRVARTGDDAVSVEVDGPTAQLLRRYLRDAGIQSVELRPDGDLQVAMEVQS